MVNTCTTRRAETESHAMVLVRDVPSGSVPCKCTRPRLSLKTIAMDLPRSLGRLGSFGALAPASRHSDALGCGEYCMIPRFHRL